MMQTVYSVVVHHLVSIIENQGPSSFGRNFKSDQLSADTESPAVWTANHAVGLPQRATTVIIRAS